MVSARLFSYVLILGMLLCAGMCECKKAHNAVKRQKKVSSKITATFRMLPSKDAIPPQRNPKMNFDKTHTTTWPASSYSGALMPQQATPYIYLRSPLTALPRWPGVAALSPIRKFDFPTAASAPFFSQNALRRSDDFLNQADWSMTPQTSLLDMSAFNGGFFGSADMQHQLLARELLNAEVPFWRPKQFSSDSKFHFLNGPFNFKEHLDAQPYGAMFF